MAFKLSDVRSIQIDHNSTCNLRCPQCARTFQGAVNPNLSMKVLPLSFYQKVFTPELGRQLESVLFCGNYGDAIAAPNITEVVAHLREVGVDRTTIITNGSLHAPEWWSELARTLQGKVCFSVDGLADTNPLYRVGS